jgi:hypothetical protein
MLGILAMVTGVSAVLMGSVLLTIWLRHGGAAGRSHFRGVQILGHATAGIVGLILLVVYVVAVHTRGMGWTTVALLVLASILGATMFLPWWWRGRQGKYGANDPSGHFPAEDHFSLRTVVIHGLLADTTAVLLAIAVLLD